MILTETTNTCTELRILDTLSINLGLLLQDCGSNSLALWHGDEWLVTLSNNKHICNTCGKCVSSSILNLDDIKGSLVLLLVHNDSYTSIVMTSSHHAHVSNVKLDKVSDLSALNIKHDGIILLDIWVWVANSAAIVGGNVWHTSLAKLDTANLAQLVGSLLFRNAVNGETSLGIIHQAEVLIGLWNGDHIHESDWVGLVCADLSVNLDQAVHQNRHHLLSVQGILESISQQQNQRKTLTCLMWTC
mmetsp:Transcript_11953/g.24032  ORF Transcript_11953/g.24032 Transcript_11953/m.24032 type:complete len:245 (-) Transcript_11953:142-876(-)